MRKLLLAATLLAPIAAHAQAVLPPNVPPNGYVLVTNAPSVVPVGYRTAGIVLPQGYLAAGAGLHVGIGKLGYTAPVQIDEKTHWPDGSVRTAVATFETPAYRADAPTANISIVPGGGAAGNPVSLAAFTPGVATVTVTPSGKAAVVLDVATLLAGQGVTYWLQGPLVTEARVDAPIEGALHVTIDVRAYADGTSQLDVQYLNDLAHAHGGNESYTAVVKLGNQTASQTIANQAPFTDWHQVVYSTGAPLAGTLIHDMPGLEAAGMIPQYPLNIGFTAAQLTADEKAPYSCAPLNACGITKYMPQTGGRMDIGVLPMWDLEAIETSDVGAIAYALQQADVASGAIPWHVEASAGTPVNVVSDPTFWADDRCKNNGGTDCSPMSYSAAITTTGITPDTAHQPSMAYLAYLLTGSRYYLDELNAQAGYSESSAWTYIRQGKPTNWASQGDLVIGSGQQLRAGAWSIREVQEASLVNPDGSPLQTYFQAATSDNWNFTAFLASNPAKGQAVGWLDNYNSAQNGGLATWQNDFVALTAEWGIHAGVGDATTALSAMTPFLVGRYLQPPGTFSPYDGSAYYLDVAPGGGAYLTTWAAIEQATENDFGYSNTGIGGCVTGPCPPGVWALDYGVAATSVVNGIPASFFPAPPPGGQTAQQQVQAWMAAHPAATYGLGGNANPAWVINP